MVITPYWVYVFTLKALSSGPTDTMHAERGGRHAMMKRWRGQHYQTILNLPLSKKIHLMNVLFFCLELGGTAMTMGGSRHGHEKWAAVLGDNQRGQSHLTWPLVHRKRPRTLSCINVCFIHLMDVVLMDFFLLMHYQ